MEQAVVNAASCFGPAPSAADAAPTDRAPGFEKEVIEQHGVATDLSWSQSFHGSEQWRLVQRLIQELGDSATQAKAVEGLLGIGKGGVGPIILQMDDRRSLGARSLTVPAPLGSFEPVAHYQPELVVDALDAIVAHITSESMGQVYNGGSTAKRRNAVNAWRVWLYHNRPAR